MLAYKKYYNIKDNIQLRDDYGVIEEQRKNYILKFEKKDRKNFINYVYRLYKNLDKKVSLEEFQFFGY